MYYPYRRKRFRRRRAADYLYDRPTTDVFTVEFVVDDLDFDLYDRFVELLTKRFGEEVKDLGYLEDSFSWDVADHLVDEFVALVESEFARAGVEVLDRNIQSAYDLRRAAVEIIDIGPTTVREEVYDMVDQAMTNVANLKAEGLRLGRYNITYDGAGWQVSDFQTGQEIDWYPDKARSTYDMVDDWNNDVWTNKNETPYGV